MTEPRRKAAEPLVEPLTRREREILGLLAQGLTASEIAERLTLAVSSVKWHIQRLYGKLGVNRKREALHRAEALGLLGSAARPAAPEPPGTKHNLPHQVTRFFGREAEIANLKARLAEHRLVTLVGSGGVGKTRLSLQAAEDVLRDFSDGVWFVGLAPLTDSTLVAQRVAASLRLREEPGQLILDRLTDFLRPRQLLLVLDNCEHLLQACAQLAECLLQNCPRLKILASSREPLGIVGEAMFSIPSLSVPAAMLTYPVASLAGHESVQLFIDRVRLALPGYDVTAQNAAAIARICQRLDGIPLALELAAARLRLLDTEVLAARLDDAFALLTGGSRTALPRQQTLRATMDWSYRLLGEDERRLLQRLAVFAGGCTLEAAEKVCSGEALQPEQVLDRLGVLVDKSMVIAERKAELDTRYHLLETVRQYAREKLNESGESRLLHTRHRDYFLAYAETIFPRLQTWEGPVWRPKMAAEHDNLRQAVEWSFRDLSAVDAGPRLVIAMRYGPWRWHEEELDWHRRAISLCQNHPEIPARLHAELLQHASTLMSGDDPQSALAVAAQAVAISRGLGPEGHEQLMWNLFQLARVYMFAVHAADRANASMAEAQSLLESLGPDHYVPEEGLRVRAHFANQRAAMANAQGRYVDAKTHASESIRLYEMSGSRWFASMGHDNFADACLALGANEEAREHLLAALNLIRHVEGWTTAYLLWSLAKVDVRLGELARALEYCRDSIREADQIPELGVVASVMGLMAAIRATQGQPAQAARLVGASTAMWVRQQRSPWENTSLDTLLPGWRDGPEVAAIQQAYDAGQTMTSDEAVAFALSEEVA